MNGHTTGGKLPAEDVAAAVLTAVRGRRPMALPGATRMLPSMLRIAPNAIGRSVARM
jgi:uncharacterized oxidoreductase